MSNIFTHHKVVLPQAMDLIIWIIPCLMLPLVLVKLIKGHFTQFKLGCFVITIPFKSVIFCFCTLVITFIVKLQEIPWLLHVFFSVFSFWTSALERLFPVNVPKITDVADSVRGRDERLSQGDWDGTGWQRGQTGWERRLLGWYFRSCAGIKTKLGGRWLSLDSTAVWDMWMGCGKFMRFNLWRCSRA